MTSGFIMIAVPDLYVIHRISSVLSNIMKVYTYSEARQRLANVLNIAKTEEVVIKRIISC